MQMECHIFVYIAYEKIASVYTINSAKHLI